MYRPSVRAEVLASIERYFLCRNYRDFLYRKCAIITGHSVYGFCTLVRICVDRFTFIR